MNEQVRLLDTSVRVSVLVPSKDSSATDFHQKRLVRLSLVRDWSGELHSSFAMIHRSPYRRSLAPMLPISAINLGHAPQPRSPSRGPSAT